MSEESISLYDLLNLSIGTPQRGAVNFSALHELLHAVLRQLGIREMKIRWRESPPRPGSRVLPEPLLEVSGTEQDTHTEKLHRTQSDMSAVEHEVQPGTELLERDASSSSPTPSKRSLSDTFRKYPDAEELSRCVTWDVMRSALLSERENLHKELINSGVVDPSTAVKPSISVSSSSRAAEDAVSPAASAVPKTSGEISTEPPQMGLTGAGMPLSQKGSSSQRYPETVEALRDIGKLKERHNKLEARVEALEEGKVDQTQLAQLRELITNKGFQDVSDNLMDQLNQQRALIDSLMRDRDKVGEKNTFKTAKHGLLHSAQHLHRDRILGVTYVCVCPKMDTLEDVFMNLKSRDRETSSEAASESVDSVSKASHELRTQISSLRKSVQKLAEDMKQLKAKEASQETTADRRLHQMSSSLHDDSDSQSQESSAVNAGEKLGLLFQRYEQLQDTLQAECEKLHETTRCLHEDNRQKQSHIEELYKTTEELEEKKADKQMVETEIKADKSALDSKVSRLQFDSVTEQINSMFHELLNKVTGQEQDWHKVIDKLSTEMECKLNRIELDSVKKQLENRWKNIHEKLQAQGAPEHEDAAGIRKQLVDRFHCLSCDRPVVKHTPGPHLVTLPSTPGFPSHKSIRPFTVYALEQFRQHYRSLKPGTNFYNYEVAKRRREQLQETRERRNPELIQKHERSDVTDYSHLVVSRSCGGSHTITSTSQRRSGLQHIKHHSQTEGDAVVQSEEVDIVGLDGHIYKGRLNAPSIRNTETKLPTICTKDDKAKNSPSKPAVSPEAGHSAPVHHPYSAKSVQVSRSGSSSARMTCDEDGEEKSLLQKPTACL
ncbi:hypothetical protein PAMP_008679 [Pampus punctatissimus]